MPTLSTTATLSGTVFFTNGRPAAGRSIIIKKVTDAHGNLISTEHTLYKTNVQGVFQAVVPQNSYVYIYADIDSFNLYKDGSPIYIGNASTYELKTMTADIDFPTQVPIALVGGGGSTTFLGLTDTPSTYSGNASKLLSVKSDESGLEFSNAALAAYALTSTLTSYSLASASGAFSVTGHSHPEYSSSAHTHSTYVSTSGNETISGTKIFQSNVKGSSTPSANDDLTNKYYVDGYIQSLKVWNQLETTSTSNDTPVDTQISGLVTSAINLLQVLSIGHQNGSLSNYYVNRADYIISEESGTVAILGVIPIHETTNLSNVGQRLLEAGGLLFSSITGDTGFEMNWTTYGTIIGL